MDHGLEMVNFVPDNGSFVCGECSIYVRGIVHFRPRKCFLYVRGIINLRLEIRSIYVRRNGTSIVWKIDIPLGNLKV